MQMRAVVGNLGGLVHSEFERKKGISKHSSDLGKQLRSMKISCIGSTHPHLPLQCSVIMWFWQLMLGHFSKDRRFSKLKCFIQKLHWEANSFSSSRDNRAVMSIVSRYGIDLGGENYQTGVLGLSTPS